MSVLRKAQERIKLRYIWVSGISQALLVASVVTTVRYLSYLITSYEVEVGLETVATPMMPSWLPLFFVTLYTGYTYFTRNAFIRTLEGNLSLKEALKHEFQTLDESSKVANHVNFYRAGGFAIGIIIFLIGVFTKIILVGLLAIIISIILQMIITYLFQFATVRAIQKPLDGYRDDLAYSKEIATGHWKLVAPLTTMVWVLNILSLVTCFFFEWYLYPLRLAIQIEILKEVAHDKTATIS